MTTVTYFSPRRVWRHTCSSTPTVVTPSNRTGSSISTRRPSARTASFAVSHATARASSTLATVRCWVTSANSAQCTGVRESLARGSATATVS